MDRYEDTSTRYRVTAVEEEEGFYKGEIILEQAPVYDFIGRRLNGLKIPFYADSHEVAFEDLSNLDYPHADSQRKIDRKYLDVLLAKLSESWPKKFKSTTTQTIRRNTYRHRNVSDEFKEIILQNVGKELVHYQRKLSIKPEEFGERPLTKLKKGEAPGKRSYVTSGCQVGYGSSI